MGFFVSLLRKHNLLQHDGRPLWKYHLSDEDFQDLKKRFQLIQSSYIDPRDATLYYSEYWRRHYNGGSPGKREVFNSIGGNIKYYSNSNQFYKQAIRGARILGVKWITKQNTLYFRTLLLQGGLPLNHISHNQGKYQSFLLAVLEEQPETIEDFMFKPEIVNHLPRSSQNEDIFQNCLEIVRAILNNDNSYDELFENDAAIKSITGVLKIKSKDLKKSQRLSKPKNYWLLNFKEGKSKIVLRLGLADTYTKESLKNILGFEATEREYQFYLNDDLICIFRRLLNNTYKTDWYGVNDYEWNLENILPQTYVLVNGEKSEVNDFIQITPTLEEPSLWAKHSKEEWRLVKGTGASNKEAAILFPENWYATQLVQNLHLYGKELSWLEFEGECQIESPEAYRKYRSNVASFDWTIEGRKPNWILKANMTVIQGSLKVFVYDGDNHKLPESAYNIYIKPRNLNQPWQNISNVKHLTPGCIQIKIEKDGVVAYDECFNIGTLNIAYSEMSISQAKLKLINGNGFQLRLDESEILDISSNSNTLHLKVNTAHSKIPTGLKGTLGYGAQKKMYVELVSPFQGMALVDAQGSIIEEDTPLSLKNLYGIRILSTPNRETILRIRNKLKPHVVISKEIKAPSQPLIAFKDEIIRLYYLADAMDYRNKVCIELKEGSQLKAYEFSGFSHTLNVENQLLGEVSLINSDDHLELYAIPLNCQSSQIAPMPLSNGGATYKLPVNEVSNQFIIISSEDDKSQLMPRFVNLQDQELLIEKEERIETYHQQLLQNGIQAECWQQLLAYFDICVQYKLPYSTFDQIRAISKSGSVAARAFLFLGINQSDADIFIQKSIPEMEKDLGFCFHWVTASDWVKALEEIGAVYGMQFFQKYARLIYEYLNENEMDEVFQFINTGRSKTEMVSHMQIKNLRSQLGERVLSELPWVSPNITSEYNIPIADHKKVSLLIKAPIFVAESIKGIQQKYSIWDANETADSIRRNIQYCQYLNKEFYKNTILYVLNNN